MCVFNNQIFIKYKFGKKKLSATFLNTLLKKHRNVVGHYTHASMTDKPTGYIVYIIYFQMNGNGRSTVAGPIIL